MKNFIEALPDVVKIRDIASDFDTMTLKALIGALIVSTADRVGMDPVELAFKIAETVVAVTDKYGYFKEDK